MRIEKVKSVGNGGDTYSLNLVVCTDGEIFVQSLTRISRFLGGVERAEQRLLDIYLDTEQLKMLKASSQCVVLDIGANIGEFSMGILRHFPSSTIIAVEPDPIAQECLKRNIFAGRNGDKLSVHAMALSDSTRDADFYLSSGEADSSLVQPRSKDMVIKVKTSTVDSLIQTLGISHITLLKMDAEGHEPEVLIGSQKTLSKVSMISVDVGAEREGSDTKDLVQKLLERNGIRSYIDFVNGTRLILRVLKND